MFFPYELSCCSLPFSLPDVSHNSYPVLLHCIQQLQCGQNTLVKVNDSEIVNDRVEKCFLNLYLAIVEGFSL